MAFAAPEMMNMFAVPFTFSMHPEHQRLNEGLRRYVFTHEKEGRGTNPLPLTQRNSELYESHFNLFRVQDPAVQELKAFCWNQLLWLVARLNNYDMPTVNRLQIFNDSWFHITRRGGFFGLHNHPNASWSGVYCVDPGKSDPGKKSSGVLSFVSPMLQTGMYQDAGNASLQLPYGNLVAQLTLVPGQLVLFPSWVLHDVKPFEGEGERVTIAFNCWFTLPDA
jgi:Putative 2OG-Fe(II) oxygenase